MVFKSKGALSIRWRKGKDVTGYQIQYSLYSDWSKTAAVKTRAFGFANYSNKN